MTSRLSRPLHALIASVAACAIAACSAPLALKEPARIPGWPDAGTPPATFAAQHEPRLYRDDKGAWWDDTGKRVASES